jgi:hypothetical protein
MVRTQPACGTGRRCALEIETTVLGQVEAAVQCGQERRRLPREQRERVIVQVEVQDIEITGPAAHPLQHQHVQRIGVPDRSAQAQRLIPHRLEGCGRDRIAAREQCHLVTERDQFLGQPVNDAFGAAVKLRRNRFGQRRNLGNAHSPPPVRPARRHDRAGP